MDERRIGVALSGGGHRATVFGMGALLALIDSSSERGGRVDQFGVGRIDRQRHRDGRP